MKLFHTEDEGGFLCEIPFQELASWGISPYDLHTPQGQNTILGNVLEFAIKNNFVTQNAYSIQYGVTLQIRQDRQCLMLQAKPIDQSAQSVMDNIIGKIMDAASKSKAYTEDEQLEIVPDKENKTDTDESLIVIHAIDINDAISISEGLACYKLSYDLANCEVFTADGRRDIILCVHLLSKDVDMADAIIHEFSITATTQVYQKQGQNKSFPVLDYYREMRKQVGSIKNLAEL